MKINKGFTLIETLFYIAGLILLLLLINNFLIYMYDWYKSATIPAKVDLIGTTLIEKITRDIQSSESINQMQSSFDTNSGNISLNDTDESMSVIKNISILNNRISYQENSGTISYLSPNEIFITRFFLKNSTTTISSAIKFDIDITYRLKNSSTTKTYNGFAILKQSYE